MRGSRRLSQDWEKKSMPNTYDVTDEREAVGGEEGAAQQLNQILASGLPPLYRKAYRILGNTADAEDAVQDAPSRCLYPPGPVQRTGTDLHVADYHPG